MLFKLLFFSSLSLSLFTLCHLINFNLMLLPMHLIKPEPIKSSNPSLTCKSNLIDTQKLIQDTTDIT